MIIFLLALGLAMDAFAVSISCGMNIGEEHRHKLVRLGLTFGGFQAVMFAVGGLLGNATKTFIEAYDHWVALGLLVVIGGKMIKESFEHKECPVNMLSFKMLMILGLATSIDALAAGVGFSAANENLLLASGWVGVVTMIMCLLGAYTFSKLMNKINLSKYVEIMGGLILIGIGIKIFLEHTLGL